MPTDESLRRAEELVGGHFVSDEDCWYSCPESGKCCDDGAAGCNCGRDGRVAKLAAALDAAREQGEREERERWRKLVETQVASLVAVEANARRKHHTTTAYVVRHQTSALRSLLSAPAEVAGREEDR